MELTRKNEEADKLIEIVGVETEKVSKEKAIADEEEKKVQEINKEVSAKQRDCEEDLKRAEPALAAAQQALNTLNKANLTELKSFGSPPPAVANVASAVMVLLSTTGKIPKDRSWQKAKIMMQKASNKITRHLALQYPLLTCWTGLLIRLINSWRASSTTTKRTSTRTLSRPWSPI